MSLFGPRTRDPDLTRVELARLEGSTATLASRLDSVLLVHDADKVDQGKINADHEARLRRFEMFMYGIPASILASTVAIIISWRH